MVISGTAYGFWPGDGDPFGPTLEYPDAIPNNVTYAAGKVGQAFNLNGSAYLDAGDLPEFEIDGNDTFTIDGWIYPRDVANFQQILSKFGGPGDGAYQLGIAPGGVLRTDVSSDGTTYEIVVSPPGTLVANQWQHVAVTFTEGQTTLYVNGATVADRLLSTTTIHSSGNAPLTIGRASIGIQHFNGLIDEIEFTRLWHRPSTIQAIFNADFAGKLKQTITENSFLLFGFWRGDGSASDNSGVHPGTLQNGANFVNGRVGQAFNFDGVNDYVTIGNPDPFEFSLLFSDEDFGVSGWINIPNAPDNPGSVCAARYPIYSSVFGYSVEVAANGHLRFRKYYNSTTAVEVLSADAISPNEYHHFVAVHRRNSLLLYINGELSATVPTTSGNVYYDVDAPEIGRSLCGPDRFYFRGQIDELAVMTGDVGQRYYREMYRNGNWLSYRAGDALIRFADMPLDPFAPQLGVVERVPINPADVPPLPVGVTALTSMYDVATTAPYTGLPTVCFKIPQVATQNDFLSLRLFHLENGVWVNRSDLASRSFASREMCTNPLPSLSPFAIGSIAPTAANVSVSGRATSARGRPVARAMVSVTDSAGTTRSVRTNTFGYYKIDDLPVGENYTVQASAKGFVFQPRIVTISDQITDLDLIADK